MDILLHLYQSRYIMLSFKLCPTIQALQVLSLVFYWHESFLFWFNFIIKEASFNNFEHSFAQSHVTEANIAGHLNSKTKLCSYKLKQTEETLQRKQI